METTWIVIANAGRARLFADPGQGKALQEVGDMVNTAARLRTSDTETDRLGPTSAGQSIHNTGGALPNKQYEPAQTPDERAAESFAKDVAAHLLQAQQDGQFDKLDIVAAPKFLGLLRACLDPQLKARVNLELDKDYTHLASHQVREHIEAVNRKQQTSG